MAEWTIIKNFASRAEAEIVKGFLADNGIEARIQADDVAMLEPALAFVSGVKLLVQDQDAVRARELLDTH